MNPYPRIRKTIRWGKYGGAALTVLLVVVWIGSRWMIAGHMSADWFAEVRSGRVEYEWLAPGFGSMTGTYFGKSRMAGWEHAFGCSASRAHFRLAVPLWVPALVTACVALAGWRLDTLARRRAGMNLCPNCRYSRIGLPHNALCPECGTPPKLNQATEKNRHG